MRGFFSCGLNLLVLFVLHVGAAEAAAPASQAEPQVPDVIPLDTLRVGDAPADTIEAEDVEIEPYEELIPSTAHTQSGLFTVHQVDEDYYFEIPLEMLDREFLLQTRITRTATGTGYGGQQESSVVVRWEQRDDRILLRLVGHENVASDTLPIYEAVRNSNFEPILQAFDVRAMPPDSGAVVVDVTSFLRSDAPILGLRQNLRETYQVRSLIGNRSYIESVRSFPNNVEVRRTVTYSAGRPPTHPEGETLSMELGHSLLLLPEVPMAPRPWDERVGYFSVRQNDFGAPAQRLLERRFIQRWRLEPSNPDAYARGELVEPVEPIVFYIDPATPRQWRPYLIQGVEDWQAAFETAGFQNAIVARMPPTPDEDPDFDPADARHSMIRYFASPVQNASGPRYYDPRSGEILGAHIQWHHNVMNLIRNWYFVQTAAANPEARAPEFDEAVMGELIRYVAAHEVGHTLGLAHNMKAHSGIPVETLRTRWVCENGTSASIMDYARFNYVAQPGDDTCFVPRIGPYDRWAIEWGYRLLPEGTDPEASRPILNHWILEREDDPLYEFGSPTGWDPRASTEALGDDPVRASDYGIENLRRVLANLHGWLYEEGEDYERLRESYTQVITQWHRYTGHVTLLIGGIEWTRLVQGQEGPPYRPVDAERQRDAMDYLDRQVFSTPLWLVDATVVQRLEPTGIQDRLRNLQRTALVQVLQVDRMQRLLDQESLLGADAYALQDLLADLRRSIWRELDTGEDIDPYRRALQRSHLDRMEALLDSSAARDSDIAPLVRGQLHMLSQEVEDARAGAGAAGDMTRLHLEDIAVRIQRVLDGEA